MFQSTFQEVSLVKKHFSYEKMIFIDGQKILKMYHSANAQCALRARFYLHATMLGYLFLPWFSGC